MRNYFLQTEFKLQLICYPHNLMAQIKLFIPLLLFRLLLMSKASNYVQLIAELTERGIKHNPKAIVAITKLNNGQIIFLETGNAQAGWQHILEKHRPDFENRGISPNQIVDLLMLAIKQGQLLGTQGRSRRIYQVNFESQLQYISIDLGSNGYLVSANPTPRKLIRRLIQGEKNG